MVTFHLLALTDSTSHVHLLSHYLDNYALEVKQTEQLKAHVTGSAGICSLTTVKTNGH